MESRTGFLISQIKQVQSRIFQRLLQDSGVEEFNGPQGRILLEAFCQEQIGVICRHLYTQSHLLFHSGSALVLPFQLNLLLLVFSAFMKALMLGYKLPPSSVHEKRAAVTRLS